MAKYTLFTQFASILLLMTQNALFKFCVNFILNFLRYVFFSSFDALYRFFQWFFYSIHGFTTCSFVFPLIARGFELRFSTKVWMFLYHCMFDTIWLYMPQVLFLVLLILSYWLYWHVEMNFFSTYLFLVASISSCLNFSFLCIHV